MSPKTEKISKKMKKSANRLEVADFFVSLQRERWVNLQRPALIPAKLNAWLFYLDNLIAVYAINQIKQFILWSPPETIEL